MHEMFVTMLRAVWGGWEKPAEPEDPELEHALSPGMQVVGDWAATRGYHDFVTVFRFEKDGKRYTYGTADSAGVRFNTSAPK